MKAIPQFEPHVYVEAKQSMVLGRWFTGSLSHVIWCEFQETFNQNCRRGEHYLKPYLPLLDGVQYGGVEFHIHPPVGSKEFGADGDWVVSFFHEGATEFTPWPTDKAGHALVPHGPGWQEAVDALRRELPYSPSHNLP